MRLEVILLLVLTALLLRLLSKTKSYEFLLAFINVFILYYLQPVTSVRYLNFWLPSINIGLVIVSWLVITPREHRSAKTIYFFIFSCILIQIFSLIRYTSWNVFVNLASPSFRVILFSLILFSSFFYLWLQEEIRNLQAISSLSVYLSYSLSSL